MCSWQDLLSRSASGTNLTLTCALGLCKALLGPSTLFVNPWNEERFWVLLAASRSPPKGELPRSWLASGCVGQRASAHAGDVAQRKPRLENLAVGG